MLKNTFNAVHIDRIVVKGADHVGSGVANDKLGVEAEFGHDKVEYPTDCFSYRINIRYGDKIKKRKTRKHEEEGTRVRLRELLEGKLPALLHPFALLLDDGVDSEAVELRHSFALRPAIDAHSDRGLVDLVGSEDGLELLDERGADIHDPGLSVVAVEAALGEIGVRRENNVTKFLS